MEQTKEQTINFDLVTGIKTMVSSYSQLDDAYLVAHFDKDTTAGHPPVDTPMRVDGMTLIMMRRGNAELCLNLDTFSVQGPALCVVHPSSRISITPADPVMAADSYILFMSQRFLQSININMSAFNLPSMVERPTPVIPLSHDELALIEQYLHLLIRNTRDQVSRQLSLSVGSSLIAALIYEMTKIHYKRINTDDSDASRPRSPRIAYVHDFIKLVRAHYAMERSVAFYASKLCISPKYLSLIVKEATGRSAARWIDEFVLMEAKNMLRYSGKNIQQVAYALNFSNQSSFGKYFKHLTGMSPTEYQKS